MEPSGSSLALDSGLDLNQLLTTGSVLHINEDYDEEAYSVNYVKDEDDDELKSDFIGSPFKSFDELEKRLQQLDASEFVKKKVLEEGGGMPLHEGCTVTVAYAGYWENEDEPFDAVRIIKPLVVDLNENGLLLGMQLAIESMLVGEVALFLFSHEVMYGEMGIPPRIKPKAKCVFYIKLLKSILTPTRKICFSEPNMFGKVHKEVKMLYTSGGVLYKSKNYTAAIQLFRKGVFMLHKCRLADEQEEAIQEKLLIKLYMNLAICHNSIKQPLKACIACNELNRLSSLWNNGKALFQNAKALRMIGQFESAGKRLQRAIKLCPGNKELEAEAELLERTRNTCNQSKLLMSKEGIPQGIVSDDFKSEVDNLIENFKENVNLCKLTLPTGLNKGEIEYVKQACARENLFFSRLQANYALDKEKEVVTETIAPPQSSQGAETVDYANKVCYEVDYDEDAHVE